MLETNVADKWLRAALLADGQLNGIVAGRIYARQAPQGTPDQPLLHPYVIFVYMGGGDTQGGGTARIFAKPLYQVKVICRGAPNDDARLVADRIDEVVGKAVAVTVAYGSSSFTINARREQPVCYTENATGTQERLDHLGGLFRIYISQN